MILLKKDTTKIFSGQPVLLRDYVNTYVQQVELLVTYFCNMGIVSVEVLHQLCRIHNLMVLRSDVRLFLNGDEINEEVIDKMNKLSLILSREYLDDVLGVQNVKNIFSKSQKQN